MKAALRLLELRAWLWRRLKHPPLAAPIDLARFTISDADMALLLKKLPLRADDADGGTGLQTIIPQARNASAMGRDPIARPGLRTAIGRMCLTSADADQSAGLTKSVDRGRPEVRFRAVRIVFDPQQTVGVTTSPIK